jgi:hypothetical protein
VSHGGPNRLRGPTNEASSNVESVSLFQPTSPGAAGAAESLRFNPLDDGTFSYPQTGRREVLSRRSCDEAQLDCNTSYPEPFNDAGGAATACCFPSPAGISNVSTRTLSSGKSKETSCFAETR